MTIENIAHPEITLTKFYSDGYDFKIQYAVLGAGIAPFDIAVYASSDGVTLEEQLEIAPANNAQGLHTLTIEPTFVDPQRDYYLIAVADPFGEVEEASETNNRATFMPGFFLVTEPSGKVVLHAHDGDDNPRPMFAWRMGPYSDGSYNWRIYTTKTAIAAPTTGTKYDFTGDGLVTTLDASAYTNYQQGNPTAWQRPGNRFDVNGDGVTAPSDALVLINDYNALGEHLLTGSPAGGEPLLDVSGDLVASVLDIAQILDKLNGGTGDVVPDSRNAAAPFSASSTAILDYLDIGQFDYGDITIDETHFRAHGGDDAMFAQSVPGWLFGGPGSDVISGGDFDDYLDGGDGSDLIRGFGGDDVIFGGAGNDELLGETNDGFDPMYPWNPIPYTPAGHDSLFGGPGNDWIEGNNGNDALFGGEGTKVFGDESGGGAEGEGGEGEGDPEDDNDTLLGGEGDDQLYGEEGNDTLDGGTGNDTIRGANGNDNLSGNAGDDMLYGGNGENSLDGGDGYDTTYPGEADYGEFSDHRIEVSLDMQRIIDVAMDTTHCDLEAGYHGCLADERYVLVTLTGPYGLSMSEIRSVPATANVTGGTDGVSFPILDPYTDYTVSVTGVGLTLERLPDPFNAPLSFNSSTVAYNSWGDVEYNFEVTLSGGINRNPDGSVPNGFTIPNAQWPSVTAGNFGYSVLAGQALRVDTDENGDSEDAISQNGILCGAYTVDYPSTENGPLNCGWYQGTQILTVQIAEAPQGGTVTLNPNGSFTYIANPDFWGQDYFRYTATNGQHVSLKGTVYVVNQAGCDCPENPGAHPASDQAYAELLSDAAIVGSAPVISNAEDNAEICTPPASGPSECGEEFQEGDQQPPGDILTLDDLVLEWSGWRNFTTVHYKSELRPQWVGPQGQAPGYTEADHQNPAFTVVEGRRADETCYIRPKDIHIQILLHAASRLEGEDRTLFNIARTLAHEFVHLEAFLRIKLQVIDPIIELNAVIATLPRSKQAAATKLAVDQLNLLIPQWMKSVGRIEDIRQKGHLDHLTDMTTAFTFNPLTERAARTYRQLAEDTPQLRTNLINAAKALAPIAGVNPNTITTLDTAINTINAARSKMNDRLRTVVDGIKQDVQGL